MLYRGPGFVSRSGHINQRVIASNPGGFALPNGGTEPLHSRGDSSCPSALEITLASNDALSWSDGYTRFKYKSEMIGVESCNYL